MQTIVVSVPELGLYFPLSLPNEIIAYKAVLVSDSKESSCVRVTFKIPTKADLALSPGALLKSLEDAGFELARIGVLAENLDEYVREDGKVLEPVDFTRENGRWVVVASTKARFQAFLKAVSKEGSPDFVDLMAVASS